MGGASVSRVAVGGVVAVGPECGRSSVVPSPCKVCEFGVQNGDGVEDGLAWHVGEGVGEVEVDDGVVMVGFVMVFDVFVKRVGTIRGAYAELVWVEGSPDFVFGVVNVRAGGKSA